jgi:hypothetical protein
MIVSGPNQSIEIIWLTSENRAAIYSDECFSDWIFYALRALLDRTFGTPLAPPHALSENAQYACLNELFCEGW